MPNRWVFAKLLGMTTQPEQSQATSGGSIPVDSFANRLMLARAHAGHLSIAEAANLCDLLDSSWANWEKGTTPRDKYDVAKVIAEKLGVDLQWLLDGGQLPAEERRPRRRRGREPNSLVTSPYRSVTGRSATHQSRPRDNRPPGHPSTGGVRRSARLPRPPYGQAA